ncbi:MAG: S1 RNA-binding domain-containing protein, partial [Acidobacteriota bacterium]
RVNGKVRNLTDFGAFVEIEEGVDGLVHVSDMSWTKRIKHPSEVLKKGDDVEAIITSIDQENRRISLSIKEFQPNDWQTFKDKYQAGDVVDGIVTRVADFGVFVQIEGLVEGLMHVSETPVGRGEKPQDHFKEGDPLRARILRIEDAEMKVGLSGQGVEPAPPAAEGQAQPAPAPEVQASSSQPAPEASAAPPPPETSPEAPAVAAAAPAETVEGEGAVKKKRTRKKAEDAAPKS